MMPRIIIVFWLIVVNSVSLRGQSTDETLMKLEYQIYQATNDTVRNDLLFEKAQKIMAEGSLDKTAWDCIERIDRDLLRNDAVLLKYSYARILLAHLNGYPQSAWAEMNRYIKYKGTLTEGESLLRIQLAFAYGVPNAEQYLTDFIDLHPEAACLSCLQEIHAMDIKERKALVFASYVLPGFGLIMNGNILRGATSMALNGSVGYGVYWLITHKMPFTGVFWGLAILPKSYFGNIRLLKTQIESKQLSKREKLATMCELFWIDLYQKYPLSIIQQ